MALYGHHIFLCSLHSLHRTAGSSSCAVWWAAVLQPHLKGEIMLNILYSQTFNAYKPGHFKEFYLNSFFCSENIINFFNILYALLKNISKCLFVRQ